MEENVSWSAIKFLVEILGLMSVLFKDVNLTTTEPNPWIEQFNSADYSSIVQRI